MVSRLSVTDSKLDNEQYWSKMQWVEGKKWPLKRQRANTIFSGNMMNVFNIGWVVNIWIIIRNFQKILSPAKNSLPHIKLVFKPTWTTKASNWGIILSIEKTPKFPPHFFNQKFRSWNFLVLFLYFSVIRLILWKKFVKKIWKPPKQK